VVLAALPVWMICPYNASLFNHILPDAYRTHPLVRDARVSREASTAYLEPGEFFKALDAEHKLPPAPRDARMLRFETPCEARLDRTRRDRLPGQRHRRWDEGSDGRLRRAGKA